MLNIISKRAIYLITLFTEFTSIAGQHILLNYVRMGMNRTKIF
jgi:hypothetical protein